MHVVQVEADIMTARDLCKRSLMASGGVPIRHGLGRCISIEGTLTPGEQTPNIGPTKRDSLIFMAFLNGLTFMVYKVPGECACVSE